MADGYNSADTRGALKAQWATQGRGLLKTKNNDFPVTAWRTQSEVDYDLKITRAEVSHWELYFQGRGVKTSPHLSGLALIRRKTGGVGKTLVWKSDVEFTSDS